MGWHGGKGGQRAALQTTGSFSSCLRHQKLRGKPHPFLDKSSTLNNLLSFLQTNLWYGLLLFFADPPCERGAQGEEYVPTKHTAAYYSSPNSEKSLFCHQAGLLSHPSACPNCQQFYVHEHKRNVHYLRDNAPLLLQMISRRCLPVTTSLWKLLPISFLSRQELQGSRKELVLSESYNKILLSIPNSPAIQKTASQTAQLQLSKPPDAQ